MIVLLGPEIRPSVNAIQRVTPRDDQKDLPRRSGQRGSAPNRSYADTLITPFGDTITYTFDARGRPVGPDLRSGGGRYSREPTWGATGVLSMLTEFGGDDPRLRGVHLPPRCVDR